jgi:hypothetical protein
VRQVVNVAPVFPLTHTLIVMATAVALAHAIRVADEDL